MESVQLGQRVIVDGLEGVVVSRVGDGPETKRWVEQLHLEPFPVAHVRLRSGEIRTYALEALESVL
ncbi:hypothetical protein ACFUTX_06785 [Microbacterium sp. NPDC057407]|uniref:hypothetical protein n=1 Tax=Microbacterium sp. NPDC057407 TaxID=3346120 RepID=UPI003670F240